ncbi:glyoxalase III HchA [uncultured Croceitalea sp.]|uniref:glyoxalase III HchA n=1 Tax=uncultured Croceitalea sp. TaxID=1798908 RepID=UPI0033063943
MIKKLLGIAPQLTDDGAYIPSKLALKLATSSSTDFDETIYQNPYKQGKLKILMVCTELRNMTMANGKKFSTGNHPVEMLVPMLHFKNAGFDIDIFTPTGQSAKIEMWAMPHNDENVKNIYTSHKIQFEHPKNLSHFVDRDMAVSNDYIAVFIPGGHGAMLGLPEDNNVGELIYWAHQKELFMLSICHGPAAFLSAQLDRTTDFIYKDYEMAVFPDSVDKQTPLIGYMPGQLPWMMSEKLTALGTKIVNKKADATCHVDRKLITGASPKAANDFGKIAVQELLKEVTM